MKQVAISACLLGKACRYDATHNLNKTLLEQLNSFELIPFCPEDAAFGTPRPTMDLIAHNNTHKAISNATGEDLTQPITAYAKAFFKTHPDITMLIGKDRSPSCGVCSAKLYTKNKQLLSTKATGLMVQEAKKQGITCIGAEAYEVKV
jgi:uncharacterized protein YbbK (DUF523 family)